MKDACSFLLQRWRNSSFFSTAIRSQTLDSNEKRGRTALSTTPPSFSESANEWSLQRAKSAEVCFHEAPPLPPFPKSSPPFFQPHLETPFAASKPKEGSAPPRRSRCTGPGKAFLYPERFLVCVPERVGRLKRYVVSKAGEGSVSRKGAS